MTRDADAPMRDAQDPGGAGVFVKLWNTRWQRIKCRFGFHWLFRKQWLTRQSDLIGCACCGREWGMNHDVRGFLPWDDELEQFYRDIGVTVNHDVQPPGIAPRGYHARRSSRDLVERLK